MSELKKINGEMGCFFQPYERGEKVMRLHESTLNTEKKVDAVIALLDDKIDTLINKITERNNADLIPVRVFSWIVVFLLVFNFAFVFGIPAVEKYFGKLIVAPINGGQP